MSGVTDPSEGDLKEETDALALDERPATMADLDHAAVRRVVGCVELTNVRLQHSHTELRAISLPEDWPDRAYLLWRAMMILREDDEFVAEVGFLVRYYDEVDAREQPELPSKGDQPERLLDVACDFELFYTLTSDADISDRDLQHFCFFNGQANAWGYMREFVHSTTARMGVPAFIAPILPVPVFRAESRPDAE